MGATAAIAAVTLVTTVYTTENQKEQHRQTVRRQDKAEEKQEKNQKRLEREMKEEAHNNKVNEDSKRIAAILRAKQTGSGLSTKGGTLQSSSLGVPKTPTPKKTLLGGY